MIRLLVCDFDGTLLPYSQKELSLTVKKQLCRIRDNGVVLAVSSGRTYGELIRYLSDFSKDMYFISCDGAYCIYGNKLIYSREIRREDMRMLLEHQSPDFSAVLHGATVNYGVGTLSSKTDIYKCIKVKSINEIKESIYKITFYGPRIKLPPYSGLRLHWEGGENGCTQLVNRYCNKGAALSDLQTRLMLTKYDTACIGDSGNDIAMMKGAKYAFSVGDGCRELSDACNGHFANIEDALEDVLEKIEF